jgi:anion-transporting  ArsA/GET3 family ATPase
MNAVSTFAPVVGRARVVVCVGPGGVGKTSCSAAIGIHAARQGRRVTVLTIDPARRLANALGLPQIGNLERDIPNSAFESLGLPPPSGRMSAMMLDIKTSWDHVVRSYHPDPVVRERLLDNRFYRTLSTSLAGSQEYMAMEKLYELVNRKEDPLDLVVLDTPPAASAVDFLEAPNRMLAALDNDATRWLLNATSSGSGLSKRIFGASSSLLVRTIGKFTGMETLNELSSMLTGFSSMYAGFQQRAGAVKQTLGDPRTVFMVVSSPRNGPLKDAEQFTRRLLKKELTLGGIVLNRATADPFTDGNKPLGLSYLTKVFEECGGSPNLAKQVFEEADLRAKEFELQTKLIARLSERFHGLNTRLVPDFTGDIHDLYGLTLMENALFG